MILFSECLGNATLGSGLREKGAIFMDMLVD